MDTDIEIAQQALASLALFRRYYASSDPYQQHKEQLAAMLEHHAGQFEKAANGDGKLLRGMAAGLRQR